MAAFLLRAVGTYDKKHSILLWLAPNFTLGGLVICLIPSVNRRMEPVGANPRGRPK
jgi:hypothetical protein